MLPKNLTVPQLRKEIRRRLKISEQLGLIKKPRKWSAGLRLDQVGNARNHHWAVKEDAACMGACRYQVQITLRSFMATAPKSIVRSVRLERTTSETWKTWQFSLAWLSPREGAEYDAAAFWDVHLQTLSLPRERGRLSIGWPWAAHIGGCACCPGWPPPPEMPSRSPPSHLHSIPLEVSEEKPDGGTSFPKSDPDEDFWKDPPSPFETK